VSTPSVSAGRTQTAAASPQTSAPNVEQQDEQIVEEEIEKHHPTLFDPEPQTEPTKIDYFEMAMLGMAGLVLFLYGIGQLSDGLKVLAGDRMKELMGKFTTNRFTGILTGAIATGVLESSSATISIAIAFVSSGVLTFPQSLAVILGSNIGTTVTAQLVAFHVNLYAPISMAAGLVLLLTVKNKVWSSVGMVLLGLGMLFFGLDLISDAMRPLRTHEPFIQFMESLASRPALGALVGALFTFVIQSSSATVGIVITLATSGLISLPAGIALMLGAEIGTCGTALLAMLGRGRPAMRTGVFQFVFNLSTAIIGVALASQLAGLARMVSGNAGTARQIANAQVIFNVVGVAAVVGFLPWIARTFEAIIPDIPKERPAASGDVEVSRFP
jgi:phosphate:Na+ symporter